ncbi:HutD/Ves family protein [Zhihengliuella halotolerans]|uniref:HutD/Ves family protein n=1 Tax=Zhihengliuella halotolerans TaxID=370736 RepID=UPI000C80C749|nr:HutD family protein [Zhihengliuella halotolerans]
MAESPQHVIRTADLPVSPWRNGRGKTREILAADGRRLSLALVDQPGEFSSFAGYTRVQTVIEGDLLLLEIDGREHALEQYRPFTYDGGAATSAVLPTGPVVALNAFAGPGTEVFVLILELSKKRPLPLVDDQYGMLLSGHGRLSADGAEDELAELDVVVGSNSSDTAVSGRGFFAVVTFQNA